MYEKKIESRFFLLLDGLIVNFSPEEEDIDSGASHEKYKEDRKENAKEDEAMRVLTTTLKRNEEI